MEQNLSFFIHDTRRNRTLFLLFDSLNIEQEIKRHEEMKDQILKGEI